MSYPRWHDGEVTFESAEAFRTELETYVSKGALRASGDDMPDPLTEFDFTLRPPDGGEGVALRGMIVSSAGGGALIQILGFDASVVSRIEEASGAGGHSVSPSGRHQLSGVFMTGAPPELDGLAGAVRNPRALAELHTLPLGPVAGVPDLSRVSTVGLLRYLGSRRASGTLVLGVAGHADRTLPMQGGYFALSRRELEPVHEWMFAGEGTFRFSVGDIATRAAAKRISPRQLVARGVLSRIRAAPIDEVRVLVDPRRGVRLTAAYDDREHALDLSDGDRRLIRRQFDDSKPVAEIAFGQQERRVLRLALMLEVMALAEPVDVAADRTAGERDPIREEYERLVHSDLFAALDLHWTSSPRLLEPKLADIRERFGPRSAAHQSSPEYAAKRLALAESAYERLSTKAGRRSYRAEVLKVDVESAAATVAQNVLVLKYRGDIDEAIERIHAAIDLVDKREFHDLLRTLTMG